ncbi:MAG TPA: SpoIID/LytB domain-containing protein [Solirubrobacterales bacterium]
MLRGTRIILLAALLLALALPATASALVRSGGVHKAVKARAWVVNGAGFGHGVGMSQYGAYGYAKHGFTYDQILTHYYTGTTIGTTADRSVRVLLRDGARSVSFRGAGSACGAGLKPGKGYVAKRKGPGVVLQSKKGRRIARCGAAMTAAGAPTVTLAGKGTYRGSLEVRASGSSLQAINVVEIEDYVRGVVSKESPASWPLEALKAQAVAARSYGLSTGIRGGNFDLYDDTRSQAYGGVAAETAKTDKAVSSTRLQVVLYAGEVAQTFFFSTSGGHTENNEFSSLGFGQPAIPYLRGVDDPFEADAGSPYEHWKRKFSIGRMNSALHSIGLRGKLKNIAVVQRGASPRIVRANLIGTGGTKSVNGPQLRSALGLPDTWASFKKK